MTENVIPGFYRICWGQEFILRPYTETVNTQKQSNTETVKLQSPRTALRYDSETKSRVFEHNPTNHTKLKAAQSDPCLIKIRQSQTDWRPCETARRPCQTAWRPCKTAWRPCETAWRLQDNLAPILCLFLSRISSC